MKCMWIGTCDLWICRWYAEHIFNHQHELSTDPIEATLPAARRRRTSSPRHKKASLQLAFVVNLQSKLDLKTPKLDPVNCWFLTFTSPISKKTICCISRWSVDESGPLRIGKQHQGGPNGWSLKVPGCFTAQQSYGLRTAGAPARTTSASLFSQRPYSSGKACFFFPSVWLQCIMKSVGRSCEGADEQRWFHGEATCGDCVVKWAYWACGTITSESEKDLSIILQAWNGSWFPWQASCQLHSDVGFHNQVLVITLVAMTFQVVLRTHPRAIWSTHHSKSYGGLATASS